MFALPPSPKIYPTPPVSLRTKLSEVWQSRTPHPPQVPTAEGSNDYLPTPKESNNNSWWLKPLDQTPTHHRTPYDVFNEANVTLHGILIISFEMGINLIIPTNRFMLARTITQQKTFCKVRLLFLVVYIFSV